MANNVVTDFVHVGFNISDAISAALSDFATERDRIHATQEAAFQTAVADNTLSPDAQVTYRQTMLDNAKDEAVPDQDYINQLQTSLASTITLAHAADVKMQIATDQANLAGELEGNQTFLTQMQTMLAGENNPDLQATIQDNITTIQGKITQAKLDLITQEVSKGTTDASTTELQKALSDAQNQKATFLAIGDTTNAATVDAQISGINQQLVNIKIDTEMNGLNINKAMDQNPLAYVNNLQSLIATADSTTPIQYLGIGSNHVMPYASEQAYLQGVLGNFLNTNFVADLQNQYMSFVTAASAQGQGGLIPDSVLATVQSEFAQLEANPTYASVADALQKSGVSVLASAVKANATAIVNNYKTDNDTNAAMTALNSLTSKYGIDTTSYQNEVTTGAASQTAGELSSISSIASNYLLTNPQMGTAAAMKQATADYESGQGGALPQSNKQLATETPSAALNPSSASIKSAVSTPPLTTPPTTNQPTSLQTPGQENGMTPATTTPTTPASSAPAGLQMPKSSPTFTSFVKTKASPTVYGVDANGTHVAFSNESDFQSAGGQDSNVQIVNTVPQNVVNFSDYNKANTPAK